MVRVRKNKATCGDGGEASRQGEEVSGRVLALRRDTALAREAGGMGLLAKGASGQSNNDDVRRLDTFGGWGSRIVAKLVRVEHIAARTKVLIETSTHFHLLSVLFVGPFEAETSVGRWFEASMHPSFVYTNSSSAEFST